MDAISAPSPSKLTPMISVDRFPVNPESSNAAGTLLITWLAATPARTSCPETNCYRLCGFPIGVSILTRLTATVCKITTGTISCHALPTVLKSACATHWNMPLFCNLAMTLIRQNRNARVRKSHSPYILCQGLQKAWNSNSSTSGSILDCMRCWTAVWKILRSMFPMTNEGVPVGTPSVFISCI